MAFPAATLQTCIVHLIRNSLDYASWKDRKALAAAIKPIYTAPSAEAALAELEAQLGREVLPDVIALALGMTRELQPQLLPLLQQQDGDGLARAAHKLKGTVAQIGADDAAKALKTLELSAREGDWPVCEDTLQQVQTELQRLRDYLASL